MPDPSADRPVAAAIIVRKKTLRDITRKIEVAVELLDNQRLPRDVFVAEMRDYCAELRRIGGTA